MRLSSRFPVAVQMLVISAWCPEEVKITSDLLALSVNTNPALIRRIMGYLKKAGLIAVSPGTGGILFTRSADEITLLDVYRAVELTEENALFGLHHDQNQSCPIGNRINDVIGPHLHNAREALEKSLEKVTIEQIKNDFPEFNREEIKKMLPEAVTRAGNL